MNPTYLAVGPDQYGNYAIYLQQTDVLNNQYWQQVDNTCPSSLNNLMACLQSQIADLQARLAAINNMPAQATLQSQADNLKTASVVAMKS